MIICEIKKESYQVKQINSLKKVGFYSDSD